MKRFVLPLVAILVLTGIGFYLQRQVAPHARQVAGWLPGSTIFFEDMPDIRRTAERWPETELAQIIDEPQMQAFLERPLGETPHRAEFDQRLAQIGRIDPLHFFLAVTDWSGSGAPKTIAGLYYSGSRQDLDSLVDELRKKVQETWPAGKPDIEKYGSGEIETFTTPDFSAGLAYRGQWIFIATDAGLLKAMLDRFEGQRDPQSLAELPAFKKTLEHLPPAPDNILFVRPGLLADKAATVALMLNPSADASQTDSLKKYEAASLALKLDGEEMRDAAYVIKADAGDQAGNETPLAKDSLRLSSSDTILAVSGRVQVPPSDARLPDPHSDPTGLLQLAASYLKIFADQGLGTQQLEQAFGPESGFLLDWPAGTMIPAPLAMMDVKDVGLAKKFLDTLTALPLAAGVEFTHVEAGGISLYTLPPTGIGLFPLQVTLGLTGKCVIGALSVDALKQGARRYDTHGAGLEGTEGFTKAAALVEEPTTSFAYVDTKAIFGRVYGLFRGVASLGFVPHLSEYVDIGKLPTPETITRHLTPMVTSGSVRDGGLLMESAGPVTAPEVVVVAALGLGAAAAPLVEQQIQGQSVTIPGFPGIGAKGSNPGQNSYISPWKKGSSVSATPGAAAPGAGMARPPASPSGGTP
jgi:hypothetical protein